MKRILINDVELNIVQVEGNGIFVDHPELRGRKCAFHRLDKSAMHMLESGSAIYTSGNKYQLIKGNKYD